jgi:AcrR family transcriptional regulator
MKTPAARGGRGRADILAAAARAIARDGFHGTSMRDLARATDRSLAGFYVHFASKEDILFALQSETFDALLESARKAVDAHEEPVARLYAFIENHVRFFAAHPDLMRVLVHEAGALPVEKRAAIRERKQRYFEIARATLEVIARSRDDVVEIERATYALFGMLNWIYGWYEPKRHGSPESLARTFHRIVLCGFEHRGGAS